MGLISEILKKVSSDYDAIYHVTKDIEDYIFEKTDILPTSNDLSIWDTILEEIHEELKLELDDKYMLRIYKMLVSCDYFDKFKSFISTVICPSFGECEYLVYDKIFKLLELNNYSLNEISEMIFKNNHYDGAMVSRYLYQNDKDELFTILEDYNMDVKTNKLFLKLCEISPKEFNGFVSEKLLTYEELYLNLDEYLGYLRDTEIIINLIKKALNQLLKVSGFNEKDISSIESFLLGKTDKNFNKVAEKSAIKFNKIKEDNDFSSGLNPNETLNGFLDNINLWMIESNLDLSNQFFKNLRLVSFYLLPISTTLLYIKNEIEENMILNDFNILLYLYIQYFMGETTHWNPENQEEAFKKLELYCKDNIADLLKALKLVCIDDQISVLTKLYTLNIKNFRPFVLEMSSSASSKKLKSFIIKQFTEDKKSEKDVIEMLKSKKKSSREIAVTVLIKWNLAKTKKLIQALLKTEKNNDIKNLIMDYIAK